MALKTRLTDLLKVEHPIMLAGMGGVSYAEVCAAMCNAGGYGVLGMAGTSPEFIAGQMKRVRELTDKPWTRRGRSALRSQRRPTAPA